MDFPFFTYTLDDHSGKDTTSTPATWYVPLTSYCNTKTLPETRGPNFRLPPGVVATLCRLRDYECDTNLWNFWCKWLDTCESYQQLPVPSEFSKVAALIENFTVNDDDGSMTENMIFMSEPLTSTRTNKVHRPTVEELIQEVKWRLELSTLSCAHDVTTIVVAGEGEPTLRLNALMQFIEELHQLSVNRPMQLRIVTNGLLSAKKTDRLLNFCCQICDLPIEFSVALMTHDSNQYNDLMEPLIATSTSCEHDDFELVPHMAVRRFVEAVVARQAMNKGSPRIEITAVDRPDVNTTLTNQMAASLGVTKPIRWRRYYE